MKKFLPKLLKSAPLGRSLFLFALTAILGFYALKNLKIEQDIVASLEKSRPEAARIFRELKGSGFFQDRIYIRLKNADPKVRLDLEEALKASSYEIMPAFEAEKLDPSELYRLFPYLPRAFQEKVLSDEHREKVLAQVRAMISAPGGLQMVRWFERDPLLLSKEIPTWIGLDPSVMENAPLLVGRVGDLNWEKIRTLYSYLKSHDRDLSFLGGDIFAFENYEAVQRDIWVCTLLSTILSLFVFRYFCRQWSLLLFLLAGTFFSSIVALVLAEVWYGVLYGLVLAFTSTFISFNNESLVHLSGVAWKDRATSFRHVIGVASALGTTLIGFLVLLFSSSHLTKQIALLSLGSLVGFIVFLLIFRDKLEIFRFREFQLPSWTWKPSVLYGLTIAVGLAIILLPKPAYRTDLLEFRYASPYLEGATREFTESTRIFSLESLYAIPIETYDQGAAQTSRDSGRFPYHPLDSYRPISDEDLAASKASLNQIFDRLKLDVEAIGIRANIAPLPEFVSLERPEYLKLWQKIWPLPWQVEGHILTFLKKDHAVPGAIALHPKSFYESILSELTADLGRLFLIGLGLMLLYLIPWQRSLTRLTLIFLPLLIATLVLQIFFYLTGRNLTIIHIMGLALVISVALDYATVLITHTHDPKEQGKVLLTGGLTLVSFGSLLFAKHPVLKEMALIVFIGTLVAWLIALFSRMPKERVKS